MLWTIRMLKMGTLKQIMLRSRILKRRVLKRRIFDHVEGLAVVERGILEGGCRRGGR